MVHEHRNTHKYKYSTGHKNGTFSIAMERESPTRRSSPFCFLPKISNFLRDHMLSKGFGFGALFFIAKEFRALKLFFSLFFFFVFDAYPFPEGFDFFAMVVLNCLLDFPKFCFCWQKKGNWGFRVTGRVLTWQGRPCLQKTEPDKWA